MSGKNQAVKVGLFVCVGLALIAALMLNFSRGVGFFKPRYQIVMRTRSVAGLKEGADAFLSGVKIGSVKRIKLDQKSKSVIVYLTILDEFPLHNDSRFVIEQQGVLGDQFVNIAPGSVEAPLLKDGDEVEGAEPFNLQEVAQSANSLIKRFDQLGATVGEAITRLNSQILDAQTLSNLASTIQNFQMLPAHAVGLIDNASGVISNSGPLLALSLTNLLDFSSKLQKVAMEVDDAILTNKVELNESMKNLRDTTASLKQMTAEMQSGKGLVGGLLKDEQLHTQVSMTLSNLSVLSSNLNSRGVWSVLWKPKQSRSDDNKSDNTRTVYPGKSEFK